MVPVASKNTRNGEIPVALTTAALRCRLPFAEAHVTPAVGEPPPDEPDPEEEPDPDDELEPELEELEPPEPEDVPDPVFEALVTTVDPG